MVKRLLASLVFTTFLAAGAAQASSFVTPEPMTAKLGPSMIALGEPENATADAEPTPAEPATKVADVVEQAPLEYPFPGGKVPVIRASGRTAAKAPSNQAAQADEPKTPAPRISPGTVAFVKVSPSIIAMSGPEPSISFEEVASVDPDDDTTSHADLLGPGPTVIRGGVVGDNGPATVSMPPAPAKKPVVAQPAAGAMAQPQPAAPSQSASYSQPAPTTPDVPVPSSTPEAPPADIVPEATVR